MNGDEREKQAKQRFFVLSAMRFVAVILVMIGMANIAGRLLPDVAPYLGYALLVVGVLDFFAAPIILKKNWAKQDAAG